jgi:hypothetical protein
MINESDAFMNKVSSIDLLNEVEEVKLGIGVK